MMGLSLGGGGVFGGKFRNSGDNLLSERFERNVESLDGPKVFKGKMYLLLSMLKDVA